MSSTAHDDQYTTAPEPLRQPYDTVAILKRNVADLEVALRKQTERAESYAETLRSLASYVGAGGYNADTVDAGVFEGKIRWGIGEIQDRLAGAIERELVNRSSLITARNDIQTWIDSRNKWMARAEAAEAELHNEKRRLSFALNRDAFYDHTSGVFFCDPAFKIPRPQVRIETKDFRAVIDALLQSAEVTDNAAGRRLLECE